LAFPWDNPEIHSTITTGLTYALDLVKSPGSIFIFSGADTFGLTLDVVRQHGFTAKPACWVKKYPPPAGKGNWWPSGFELAVYGYQPKAYFGDTNTKRSNVFVSDSMRYGQPGKNGHPTQKPLGLIQHLGNVFSSSERICVGPFHGKWNPVRSMYLDWTTCSWY